MFSHFCICASRRQLAPAKVSFSESGPEVVHVDDVATGHLLARDQGRSGQRYLLGSGNMSLVEILGAVAGIVGGRPPRWRLSPDWLFPFARVAQGWARITRGREPRLTVEGLHMAKRRMYFSDAKARAELGWSPRAPLEGLRDAVSWFRGEGYLR